MRLESELSDGLRKMASANLDVSEMAHWVLEQLSLDAVRGRIQVIASIQQAFFLSAGDAAAVGAWNLFPMSLIHTVPSPPFGSSAGRRSPVSRPRSTALAATGRPLRRPNGLLYVCVVLDNSLEILELIETAHTYVNLEMWTVGETIDSNGGIAPLEKHTVPRVG